MSRGMLFKFKWYRCQHGYRIADLPPEKTILTEGTDDGKLIRCIVPNSDSWEEYRPLDTPAAYKAFARLIDRVAKLGPRQALVELSNAYGSMIKPRAPLEPTGDVLHRSRKIRDLVAKIEARDWDWIKKWLAAAQGGTDLRDRPMPGIGRLGVAFDVEDGRPKFRLTPPTLFEALYAQALFDAAHGIEHKACKNPECDRYFPISGPDAHRKDALYCRDTCRLRHVYLKKKEGV